MSDRNLLFHRFGSIQAWQSTSLEYSLIVPSPACGPQDAWPANHMKWSIGHKIGLSFALVLNMLCAIGIVAYRSIARLSETQQLVAHTLEVLHELELVYSEAKDVQRGSRGFVITGDEQFLAPYRSALSNVVLAAANVRHLTADNPRQQQRIQELDGLLSSALEEFKKTVEIRRVGGLNPAMEEVRRGEGNRLLGEIGRVVLTMKDEESNLLKTRAEAAAASSRQARIIIVLGSLIALVSVAAFASVIFRDIRTRAVLQQKLQTALETNERILAQSLDVICTIDREGRFVRVSAAAEQVWKYRPETLIGRRYMDLVHPEDRPETERIAANIVAGKAVRAFENRYLCRDGSVVPIIWSAHWSAADQLMYCVARDNSERIQAQLELAQARDAALESARLKAEFLANMSHEIRTPMNGVIGMTELLLATPLTATQREYTETIRTSGEGLLSIINDVLDFSKIEAGKLIFETVDFDLVKVVEGAVEMLARPAQVKGIEVICTIDPTVPSLLRGDPGRLRQVLTNLIGNAIKFTTQGGVITRVAAVEVTEVEALVRFSVSDTGIGISLEAQQRLFQVFSQADGSTTRRFGGTGLGLAISKQLVSRMAGDIGVQSEEGKGSTFWFTARFARQLLEIGESASSVPTPLKELRVLVVDGSEISRTVLKQQVNTWGMIDGSAKNAGEALTTLRGASLSGTPYDLVLLDFDIPEVGGLRLAQAIKADPAIAKAKLVLLSSRGDPPADTVLQTHGIDALVPKPVSQSRLFDQIVRLFCSAIEDQAVEVSVTVSAEHDLSRAVSALALRVLLAEDNLINQKVALGFLNSLGCAVEIANDGFEVLERLLSKPYDAILMDCQMPRLDGYETARRIRELEKGKSVIWQPPIRIIAMTAHAMAGDREKCLANGMDDYIAKPIRRSVLMAALNQCLPIRLPSHETGTADTDQVDWATLAETTSDEPEVMRQIIGLVISHTPEYLKAIERAIQSNNATDVREAAHRCLGACKQTGLVAVARMLEEIEHRAAKGDLGNAADLCQRANVAFASAEVLLSQKLKELPRDEVLRR
jgi:two-component system sensor histidine kinase/response regulator